MNLDYSVFEVARDAEASQDHPWISWPVNSDYSVLEVAIGVLRHPGIILGYPGL